MDSIFGVTGKDWVILASDSSCTASGIIVVKSDEDKLYPIGDDKILACQGKDPDRVRFCEYIQRNMALSALRDSHKHTAHSVACFVRNELAYAIRNGPYEVNTLIAGVTDLPKIEIKYPQIKDISAPVANSGVEVEEDDDNDDDGNNDDEGCATMYCVDCYGALQKVRYAAQGYGALFTLGLMDRVWRKDMSFEEGLDLIRACIRESQTRMAVHCPKYIIKAIKKGEGISVIDSPALPNALPPFHPF